MYAAPSPAYFPWDITCGPRIGAGSSQSGGRQHVGRCLQAYAVEKCRLEARRHGHTVTEGPIVDESVKLTVTVVGAAGLSNGNPASEVETVDVEPVAETRDDTIDRSASNVPLPARRDDGLF